MLWLRILQLFWTNTAFLIIFSLAFSKFILQKQSHPDAQWCSVLLMLDRASDTADHPTTGWDPGWVDQGLLCSGSPEPSFSVATVSHRVQFWAPVISAPSLRTNPLTMQMTLYLSLTCFSAADLSQTLLKVGCLTAFSTLIRGNLVWAPQICV